MKTFFDCLSLCAGFFRLLPFYFLTCAHGETFGEWHERKFGNRFGDGFQNHTRE